jgi:hypothetical protein
VELINKNVLRTIAVVTNSERAAAAG